MTDPTVAEFTLDDGSPVSGNLSLVTHWAPLDARTIMYFCDGQSVTVRENYDLVSEYLNPERQAGE